jgi:hypothetical protein
MRDISPQLTLPDGLEFILFFFSAGELLTVGLLGAQRMSLEEMKGLPYFPCRRK